MTDYIKCAHSSCLEDRGLYVMHLRHANDALDSCIIPRFYVDECDLRSSTTRFMPIHIGQHAIRHTTTDAKKLPQSLIKAAVHRRSSDSSKPRDAGHSIRSFIGCPLALRESIKVAPSLGLVGKCRPQGNAHLQWEPATRCEMQCFINGWNKRQEHGR